VWVDQCDGEVGFLAKDYGNGKNFLCGPRLQECKRVNTSKKLFCVLFVFVGKENLDPLGFFM